MFITSTTLAPHSFSFALSHSLTLSLNVSQSLSRVIFNVSLRSVEVTERKKVSMIHISDRSIRFHFDIDKVS